MSDGKLRELERRWQATGEDEHELAWLRERARVVPSFAVISDVESNLEALRAVLAHVDALGVQRVLCLGDVVGHGPDPAACVDLVRERVAVTLLGACEEQVLAPNGSWGSKLSADRLAWAHAQLKPGLLGSRAARERWRWLGALSRTHLEGGRLCVHGSPRDIWDRIQPHDWGYAERRHEVLGSFPQDVLLAGRSHFAGLFSAAGVQLPEADGERATLASGTRWIVTPGSVGTPYDEGPDARYCLVSGELVRWFRVPYDVERTVAKLEAQGVHELLVNRVRYGSLGVAPHEDPSPEG